MVLTLFLHCNGVSVQQPLCRVERERRKHEGRRKVVSKTGERKREGVREGESMREHQRASGGCL
jgi:hypothetical protein